MDKIIFTKIIIKTMQIKIIKETNRIIIKTITEIIIQNKITLKITTILMTEEDLLTKKE